MNQTFTQPELKMIMSLAKKETEYFNDYEERITMQKQKSTDDVNRLERVQKALTTLRGIMDEARTHIDS